MLAILLSLSLVVAASLCYIYSSQPCILRNGRRLPRPPNTLPVLGNGIHFLRSRHALFHWFTKCANQFGLESYEISVPSLPPGVVINDPRNLEFVFKNDEIFTKGDFFRKRSWDLFGNGIINADGALWKAQRKAGLRFFSNSNVERLIDAELPEFMKKTENALDRAAQSGEAIDLEEVFLDLTTTVMGRLAYNMDMEASHPFSRSFDFASGAITARFQNPLWPLTEFFFGSRLRQALKEVRQFGKQIVAKAVHDHSLALKSTHERAALSRPTLISLFLDSLGDHSIVADAALNFLSAGRDTLAQALTWTFYLLSQHPDVVLRIRVELSKIAREDAEKGQSNPAPHLDYSTIQSSLPITHATFLEALRLYPPVPFELKTTTATTTLPDGTVLPKGAVVVWCPWSMARSTHIWGPDAGIFNINRWLDHNPATEDLSLGTDAPNVALKQSPSASSYPVFNGGARLCLGKKMAEMQAIYVIARLVSQWDFVGAEPGERRSRDSLTLPMEGGFPVFVSKREDRAA